MRAINPAYVPIMMKEKKGSGAASVEGLLLLQCFLKVA
jgi:hypothetical protein